MKKNKYSLNEKKKSHYNSKSLTIKPTLYIIQYTLIYWYK